MEAFKRVGTVLFFAVCGIIAGTVFNLALGIVSSVLGRSGSIAPGSAMTVATGVYGPVLAVIGAMVGKDRAAKKGLQPSRAANVAAWLVAAIITVVCLSILFTS